MSPLPLIHGTVSYWRDDKGFGFVSTEQAGRVFFHIRDFHPAPLKRPQQGDTLSFQLGMDKQKRPYALAIQFQNRAGHCAKAATVCGPNLEKVHHQAWCFRYVFFALLVLSLLAGCFIFTFPLFYLEASLFTYWLYQIDKKLACSGQTSRLPEESLQMFSLIGGWPGALVAQKHLRHKVHKAPFQREFRFVIYGNSCFLLWLLSEPGSEFLRKVALF